MINDDYISTADELLTPQIKMARLKASEIWNEFCEKKIPIILNVVIQKLGINVTGMELTSIDGITKTDGDICLVVYDQNSPIVRQRFTVAHEIGHIALEHTSLWGGCNQYSKKSQEKEADAFAGELLVPSDDIKLFAKNGCTIKDIMKRYWISESAAFVAVENNKLLKKIKV